MKIPNFVFAICIILVFFTLENCTQEKDPESKAVKQLDFDALSFSHAMKGWELYSWPNGNDRNYAILPGTNRLKTYQEVINHEIMVLGKDSLKMLLDKFPPGEEIFWISVTWLERIWGSDYGTISLPDVFTIAEIQSYCEARELLLVISE